MWQNNLSQCQSLKELRINEKEHIPVGFTVRF